MHNRRQTSTGRLNGRTEQYGYAAATAFEEFAGASSRDLDYLRNGVLDSRIRVTLEKNGMRGEAILLVTDGDEGLEARVLASTFNLVQPTVDGVPLTLPLDLLFLEELSDGEWASLTPEQSELRTLLRIVLTKPVVDERTKRSQQLQVSHLKSKPKFWKGHELFHVGAQNRRAYFERRHRGGVRILALMKADHDHPLSVLLEAHREVEIEISQIFDPSFKTITVGDLRILKEAQREFAKYMSDLVSEIGYEPRSAKHKQGAISK